MALSPADALAFLVRRPAHVSECEMRMTPAKAAKLRRIQLLACYHKGTEKDTWHEGGRIHVQTRCACACRCDLTLYPPMTFKEAKARGFPNAGHPKFPEIAKAIYQKEM